MSLVLASGAGLIALMLFTNTCGDERPTVDEKAGAYGKTLGEVKEEEAKTAPSAGNEMTTARQRFIASSQVQLGVMAAEIESRSRNKTIPIERIESLRRDYWVLAEMRRQVLDAPDAGYDEALNQYEAQVDTIREQLSRVDRGQLP